MRSQVINMIGYAGDITTAKSRLGIYSALIMVKGGTSGTSIKVVTCSTSDGEFVDYVKLADGASDIVKGFYVDLSGADKYIKVTGATYADVVFGDCDFDPKSIVTTGSVPAPTADLDNNKTATINVSTYTEPVEVTPTAGKDGMKKVTVSLSNMPEVETTKQATIDVSTYDPSNKPVIVPTSGKQSMAEVEVTLSNIPSGDSATAYAWVDTKNNVQYFDFGTSPSSLEELSNKKILESSVGEYSLAFLRVKALSGAVKDYTRISDTSFTYIIQPFPDFPAVTETLTRDPTKDFTLWQITEIGD